MAGRVSVKQAARIADIPLAEALYVLNLAAGAEEKQLASELEHLRPENFECISSNPPLKPRELLGLTDDDPRVHFLDVTLQAEHNEDPKLRGQNPVPVEQWKDGQFISPHCPRWDSAGNLYVAEWLSSGRITKLKRVK